MKMEGIGISICHMKKDPRTVSPCYNLDGIETGTAFEDRAALMDDAKIPGTSCGICRNQFLASKSDYM